MSKRTIIKIVLGILSLIFLIIYYSTFFSKNSLPDSHIIDNVVLKPSLVMEDQYYSSQRNDLLKRIDSLAFSQKDNTKISELNEQLIEIIDEQDLLRKKNNYQVQAAEYCNQVRIFLEQRREGFHFWTKVFRISTIILIILLILAIKFLKSDY